MKPTEFGMFPCHFTLHRVFGDKKSVTEKSFVTYWETVFANRTRNLSENKRTPVSPQSLILYMWTGVTDSSLQIATTCAWKTKVSSYHFETNK